MPLIVQQNELGPEIGGSAKSPKASARVRITGVEPSHTLDDITQAVIAWAAPTVTFRVPTPNSLTASSTWTTLHLSAVMPRMVSDTMAEATIEWAVADAAPAPTTGEQKPSETPPDQVLGPEYSFDAQAGTIHITKSIQTRWRGKVGGTIIAADGDPDSSLTAPHLKNAIGVTGDGEVKGCDIYKGDLKFSVTVRNAPITLEYIRKVAEITGTINDDEFFSFEAGELLFLGCVPTYKPGDGWHATYSFHVARNQEFFTACPGVVFPIVYGHDYVWVRYERSTVGGFTVETPVAAYCEQVYEVSDFSELEDFD